MESPQYKQSKSGKIYRLSSGGNWYLVKNYPCLHKKNGTFSPVKKPVKGKDIHLCKNGKPGKNFY